MEKDGKEDYRLTYDKTWENALHNRNLYVVIIYNLYCSSMRAVRMLVNVSAVEVNRMAQTTIMVKERNKRRLDRLKDEIGAASYDQVVSYLFGGMRNVPESMFGARRGRPAFVREEDGVDDRINTRYLVPDRVLPGYSCGGQGEEDPRRPE
jgi:hypothetical protein